MASVKQKNSEREAIRKGTLGVCSQARDNVTWNASRKVPHPLNRVGEGGPRRTNEPIRSSLPFPFPSLPQNFCCPLS